MVRRCGFSGFGKKGCEPRRTEVGGAVGFGTPRRPYSEHLARYRVADLALDTFPYTSHTTLNDALWCGCPTVGLTGDTFAARVAGSILSAAGMHELITPSIAEYEALALRLATDAVALSEVRAKVVQARDSEAQFDTAQFTRDLERLYQGILAPCAVGQRL